MGHDIQVVRIRPGRYQVTRSDGRVFVVLRGSREWVIEAQDTLKLSGHPLLRGALHDIRQGWTTGVTK